MATSPFLASATEFPAPQRSNAGKKVIKDPVEYNAYVSAINTRDPLQRAAAIEAFLQSYPQSVAKVDALEHAMAAYEDAGKTDKVDDAARRILALEPNNVRALAVIVYIERSSGSGLAAEGCASARRGLQILENWQKPESLGEPEYHKIRGS